MLQTIQPSVEPVSLAEAKNHLRVDADLTADDGLIGGILLPAARRYAEAYTGRSFIAQGWRMVLDSFPGRVLEVVPWGSSLNLPANAIQLDRGNVLAVTSITYMDMNGTWQTADPSTYVAELTVCPGRITPIFGQIWPIPRPQIGSVKVDYIAGYGTRITADATADTITPDLWPALSVGDPVALCNSGGALPAGLTAGRTYYVQSIPTPGSYKLAATAGGAAIDITDTGSGISYLGIVPEGIRQWILMRLSTLYLNREEVAVLARGKVEPLPYVDALLDPYRVELA